MAEEKFLETLVSKLRVVRKRNSRPDHDIAIEADMAIRSMILSHCRDYDGLEENTAILHALREGDPTMLPSVMSMLAKIPEHESILKILENANSTNNARIEAQNEIWNSRWYTEKLIAPWLALMRDEDMASAVSYFFTFKHPRKQDLNIYADDIMLDPRKLNERLDEEALRHQAIAVDDGPPQSKRQKRDKHQRSFKTHQLRAQKAIPSDPISFQSLQLTQEGITSGHLAIDFEYDFLNDNFDTSNTKRQRTALWSIATMFEGTGPKPEFIGGSKILDVLLDKRNWVTDCDVSSSREPAPRDQETPNENKEIGITTADVPASCHSDIYCDSSDRDGAGMSGPDNAQGEPYFSTRKRQDASGKSYGVQQKSGSQGALRIRSGNTNAGDYR